MRRALVLLDIYPGLRAIAVCTILGVMGCDDDVNTSVDPLTRPDASGTDTATTDTATTDTATTGVACTCYLDQDGDLEFADGTTNAPVHSTCLEVTSAGCTVSLGNTVYTGQKKAGTDCHDKNANIGKGQAEPRMSGLTADMVDNDCDGFTDEATFDVSMGWYNGSALVKDGTVFGSKSTYPSPLILKITVKNRGPGSTLPAQRKATVKITTENGGSYTILDEEFEIAPLLKPLAKDASVTLDVEFPVTLDGDTIPQAFQAEVTIPGDEQSHLSRLVLFNAKDRKLMRVDNLTKAGTAPSVLVTGSATTDEVTSVAKEAMRMEMSPSMLGQAFDEMSEAFKARLEGPYTVANPDAWMITSGAGHDCQKTASGASQWGRPMKAVDMGPGASWWTTQVTPGMTIDYGLNTDGTVKSGKCYRGFAFIKSMTVGNARLGMVTEDGSASAPSGMPNTAAAGHTSAEQSAVKANSVTIELELEDLTLEVSHREFVCVNTAGCGKVGSDGSLPSMNADVSDNQMTDFSVDKANCDAVETREYRVGSLRFEIEGMFAPAPPADYVKSWSRADLTANADRSYPQGYEADLAEVDTKNDPYLEYAPLPGQLAFVVARMGVKVLKNGAWVTPTSVSDVEVTGNSDAAYYDWVIDRVIYQLAQALPQNKALSYFTGKDTNASGFSDSSGDDEKADDQLGMQILQTLYCGIIDGANKPIRFKADPSTDTLSARDDDDNLVPHGLMPGDLVKVLEAKVGSATATSSQGVVGGVQYAVATITDASSFKVKTTSGTAVDIKSAETGLFVEGPFGAHSARFKTEYDLIEYALDSTYAKKSSEGLSRLFYTKAACPAGNTPCDGEPTCVAHTVQSLTSKVDILPTGAFAITSDLRPLSANEGLTTFFYGGTVTNIGTESECDAMGLGLSEGSFMANLAAEMPRGITRSDSVPFNCDENDIEDNGLPEGKCDPDEDAPKCDSDDDCEEAQACNDNGYCVALNCEGELNIKLTSLTPFPVVGTPDDQGSQSYSIVTEGISMVVTAGSNCVIDMKYPFAEKAGNARCALGTWVGKATSSVAFAEPSDTQLATAQTQYIEATEDVDLCGRTTEDDETPLSLFVGVRADGALTYLYGPKTSQPGCEGPLAKVVSKVLTSKLDTVVTSALKQQACGTCSKKSDGQPHWPDAFQAMVPGYDFSARQDDANAYCAMPEECDEDCIYVQRFVSEDFNAHDVLVGRVDPDSASRVANLSMTLWQPSASGVLGDEFCGDDGSTTSDEVCLE